LKLPNRLKFFLNFFLNRDVNESLLHQHNQQEHPIHLDNGLLSGKNVLITGAGRNIGRGIAIEMAKQNGNILFTDIDQEKCTKLERELAKYPVKFRGIVSDISNTENINSLYNSLIKDKVVIDILVNNVGINSKNRGIKELNLRELNEVFNINVFGPVHLTKLISSMMITNKIPGSIIFITSIHQWEIQGYPVYSASKAALGMIIKELAMELMPHRIRVNGIAPGWVVDDEQGNTVPHRYPSLYDSSITPQYIGRAALYLASDYYSKFTTGSVIKLDAGLSLHNYQSL
jgi:NAD(P)-dependent dehydrogenase (short-subunit alcohol dehydrogenase family)